MRQLLVVMPFVLIFLVLMGFCIAAVVLNIQEHHRAKVDLPIPLDLSSPLPAGTGFPWSPKFRGQRWPDPNGAQVQITIESAKRYAGAAERRARRCLLMGDAAIFILAIPSGLFAPMFIQRWPDPPPTAGWWSISLVLASMIGGISLRVYAAPYWEEIRDAYLEATERLTTAQRELAPAVTKGRKVSDRFKAAWRGFVG